jgi:hypothetical protein
MDMGNAKRMFKLTRTFIIPNPSPICYDNLEEYISLRDKRMDYSRPYFLLLAGGRGNEEAVKLTIKIFNRFPPEKFKLIITGPWLGIKNLVRNSSIEILGTVPHERLKEILAMADYGLAPIFSHISGTFLKTLAYVAAGLDIVGSAYSVQGIDLPRELKTYIVNGLEEYRNTIFRLTNEVSYNTKTVRDRRVALQSAMQRNNEMESLCRELASLTMNSINQ